MTVPRCPTRPRVIDLRLTPAEMPLPRMARGPLLDNDQAAAIARAFIGDLAGEHFIALFVAPSGCLTSVSETYSSASNREVVVDATGVIRAAILANAAGIVSAHSHSGSAEPSTADRKFWKHLERVADAAGIESIDDLVIGPDAFYSRALGEIRPYPDRE